MKTAAPVRAAAQAAITGLLLRGDQVVDWGFCYECHADANESHPCGDKNPNGELRFFPCRAPL